MLNRLALIGLVALAVALPLHALARQAAPGLRDAFARANADASNVVPLIVEGSASLARMHDAEAVLLADTLEPYTRRAFFTPERLPGMEKLGLVIHSVKRGDTLSKIAQRYHVGAGLLFQLNADLDERKLGVGQALKVLDLSDQTLSIEVDTRAFRALAWKSGANGAGRILIGCWQVGLGAPESPTPHGRTRVERRVLDPEWTHPVTKQVFAPHDAGNILGGFWIGLESDGIGKKGIGFHGFTGDVPKNWIGEAASNGCVRMLQTDIKRLYDLALEGTLVTIE